MFEKKVPKSLRVWFLIHFVVDIIFAIPLMFFPAWLLNLLTLPVDETVTARLVGAALIGIGGASFFAHKKGWETYDILLTLKILWSVSAIVALLISFFVTMNPVIWLLIIIFGVFSGIWMYYKFRD
jgi:hypothetical protein